MVKYFIFYKVSVFSGLRNILCMKVDLSNFKIFLRYIYVWYLENYFSSFYYDY